MSLSSFLSLPLSLKSISMSLGEDKKLKKEKMMVWTEIRYYKKTDSNILSNCFYLEYLSPYYIFFFFFLANTKAIY